MSVRPRLWLTVPLGVGLCGIAWMQLAVMHFEKITGRGSYGLARVHYSTLTYHPGGQAIHRWTTIVPPYVTVAFIGLSLLLALGFERKSGWRFLLGVAIVHIDVAAAFAVVAAVYDMTVTGVFI